MKILLPTSADFDLAVSRVDQVVRYDVTRPIPVEHEGAEVLVAWGNTADRLKDAASRLRALRWVQTLSAGAEAFRQAGFADEVLITSGATLHDRPVAEHALALILAAARRLHVTIPAQREHRWAGELGGIQPEHDPTAFTTLRGAQILLWGYGGIARTLAPLLIALGAEVTGVARSGRNDAGIRVVPVDDIRAVLPGTDVLLMMLPAAPSTMAVLDAELLGLLGRRSWVINVGRGSTIDQDALIAALMGGRIGGAALDVTNPEPLPAGSMLWDLPNVIITPHAAGGRPLGAAALIEQNLEHLRRGERLRNVVTG